MTYWPILAALGAVALLFGLAFVLGCCRMAAPDSPDEHSGGWGV